MPVGTVRGRFELDAPALRTLKDLEKQGIRTQAEMKKLADQMDRVAGQKDAAKIKEYSQTIADLRRTTQNSMRMMREEWVATTRVVRYEVNKQQRAIRELEASLDRLGSKRVAAKVSVRGAGPAAAKLAVLNTGLDRADRGVVNSSIAAPARKAVTGSMRGGGGAGRIGGGALDFGLPGLRPRSALIAAGVGFGPSLAGAGIGLAGSAGMAALGAGATGIAGAGALAGGIGANLLVGKQTVSQITAAQKATQKYTAAVADFGRKSNQARRAKLDLDQAMSTAPKGTRQLLRETSSLSKAFHQDTAPGRQSFMQMLLGGARAGRRLEPFAAGQINRVVGATSRQGTRLADFAAGDVGRRGIRNAAGAFGANIGNARVAGQYGLESAINVMQASRPFLREMTDTIKVWTRGWATSTRDITSTRSHIREMVDHLKSWVRLTQATGGLLGSLAGAGAKSGQTMVDHLTRQLREWTVWVKQNPTKIREFFRNSVASTEKLATGLASVAKSIWNIASALRPALDRFTQLVGLAGKAGLLTPGAGALAFGAFRGVTGRGGGGLMGMMGGGGRGAPRAAGGGVRGAARTAAGTPGYMAGTYGIARSFGYGRTASAGAAALGGLAPAGRVAGMAVRGAGKAFWPVAAGLAALDFAGTPGNIGQRTQAALSGATLGLIPRPVTGAEHTDRGLNAADKFLGGLSSSDGLGAQKGAIGSIQAQIAANHARAGQRGHLVSTAVGRGGVQSHRVGGVGAGEQQELKAQNGALRKALAERVAVYRQYRRDRDRELDAMSRRKGTDAAGRIFGEGIQKRGPGWAAGKAIQGFAGRHGSGVESLGEAGLTKLRQEVHKNTPGAQAAYDKLVGGIERRFKTLGHHVQIVNGDILRGTKSEWGAIADSMRNAAQRGVKETSQEWDRLKAKAMGSLTAMGFSKSQASDLFRFSNAGGETAKRATRAIADPGRYKNAPAYQAPNGKVGDGPGTTADRPSMGTVGKSAAATGGGMAGGGGLMGANANLGPYAQLGASMGLHVSSGLRPGAITTSGNTSWHASGHAIDVAGPPAQMMQFFQAMKSQYGSGLEELIYGPGQVGIKNGAAFNFGPALNAQHMDHVHVADKDPSGVAGPGGALGGGAGGGAPGGMTLKAKQSGLGGVTGALSTRAMGGMAAGINAALAAAGGGAGGGANGVMTFEQVARLAESVGLPGTAFAQIAKGESGFNPRAVGHDPGGTQGLGLWQITTGFNDDIIKRFGGRDAMFNPQTNAQAAKAIYDRAGIKAWYGTKFLTDPTAHFTGDGPGKNGHTRSVGSRATSSRPRGSGFSRRRAHRGAMGGGLVNVNFHGDMHVRSSADVEAVAAKVAQKITDVLKRGTPDSALA